MEERGEPGSDYGEVGLRSLGEDVEEEKDDKTKGREREKWVLIEEAEMEKVVIEEAIVFVGGFEGGTRCGSGEEGSVMNKLRRGVGEWGFVEDEGSEEG